MRLRLNAKLWLAVVIGLGVWLRVATSESPTRAGYAIYTHAEMLQFGLIAGVLAAVFTYGLLTGADRLWRRVQRWAEQIERESPPKNS